MKKILTIVSFGAALSLGVASASEPLPTHAVPKSQDGDLVVGMCDGETFLEVDGVKPGQTLSRAQGQAISDQLMREWRKKNPDAKWDAAVKVAQAPNPPPKPPPSSTGPVSQKGPTAGTDASGMKQEKGTNVQSGHTYGAFTERDEQLWKLSVEDWVKEGHAVFHDAKKLGSTVAISCDMCHPDASNTHPETYPKFQVQLGRVAMLRDMINWCIENPVRGAPLAEDDPRMKAMEAYIYAQRKGKALEYGKH